MTITNITMAGTMGILTTGLASWPIIMLIGWLKPELLDEHQLIVRGFGLLAIMISVAWYGIISLACGQSGTAIDTGPR